MALVDLTELNRALIAATGTRADEGDEADTQPTSSFDEAIGNLGLETPQNTGTDTTFTAAVGGGDPSTFQSFSAVDRLGFERVVNWIVENAFGGSATGRTTAIDAFVNDWAIEWRTQQGIGPKLSQLEQAELRNLRDPTFREANKITSADARKRVNDLLDKSKGATPVPTLEQLLETDGFGSGATWLPVTSEGGLPPLFTTETESVDADGNPIITPVIGVSDPLKGVQFVETTVASDPRVWGTKAASALRQVIKQAPRSAAGADIINRATAGGFTETGKPVSFDNLDPFGMPDDVFLINLYRNTPPELEKPLPNFTLDELAEKLAGPRPKGPSGGGGGGTQRSIEFDRDELMSKTSDVWGQWFLENAPETQVAGIVDDYMREARSFWVGKGGQLDFETFVKNRLKKQPKYTTFFRNKAPDMSEEQHNAQFVNPIRSIGLRPEVATAESIGAITSGASPSDQLKRVTRTREAENLSGFSRKLAATVAGLGGGARA